MSAASASNPVTGLIRLLGLAALVAIALFPPWQLRYTAEGQKQAISAGYHPLWDPPAQEVEIPEGATDSGHRINVIRLGIQLVGVLALMNGALFLLRRPEP